MLVAGAEEKDAVVGGWRIDFARRTAAELYAIASDVESYPQFVPWCVAARILARDGDSLSVDNVYGVGPLRIRFRSRAVLDPPHGLVIRSEDGPFRSFRLSWAFAPRPRGGATVEARFEAVPCSELLRLVARISLREAERRIVASFRRRAESLYGPD